MRFTCFIYNLQQHGSRVLERHRVVVFERKTRAIHKRDISERGGDPVSLGCREPGVSRLSKLPLRHAGKQVGAWGLTDLFEIWTSGRSAASISGELRSSLTVSPKSTESSSQWTTLVSLLHGDSQQPRVVWLSGTFARRRKGHTLNSHPTPPGSSHSSIRETLERFVGVSNVGEDVPSVYDVLNVAILV